MTQLTIDLEHDDLELVLASIHAAKRLRDRRRIVPVPPPPVLAPPPAEWTIFASQFDTLPPGDLVAGSDWSPANQLSASTTIEGGQLVCRTRDSLTLDNPPPVQDVGARAFFSGLRWDRFTPYLGQTLRFRISFETPLTTIAQGGFWSIFEIKYADNLPAGVQVNIESGATGFMNFWIGTGGLPFAPHSNPLMRAIRPDTLETVDVIVYLSHDPAQGSVTLVFDGQQISAPAITCAADGGSGCALTSYTNGAEATEVRFGDLTVTLLS